MFRRLLLGLIGAASLLPAAAASTSPRIEIRAPTGGAVAAMLDRPGRPLPPAAKIALLRAKIRYVFVLFQENRSFDQHFGTFPGVDGLFSRPAEQTPGFRQPIVDTDGRVGTVSPFLITAAMPGTGQPLYPADTDTVDHSHAGIDNSLDVTDGTTRNDRYALNEEALTTRNGAIVGRANGVPLKNLKAPTLLQKQRAELVMAHLDCDTIPFLWQLADRFTIFDDFHQSIVGPSTPNAIAMIAGQSGQTQWALHPNLGADEIAASPAAASAIAATGSEPVVSDPDPYAGSALDHSAVKPPYGPKDAPPSAPALNQTYASLPLSFMGHDIRTLIASDPNPAFDLADVQGDLQTVARTDMRVPWGWYQEGYGLEPTDSGGKPSFATYITHHNGPQYFGYVGDNPRVASNLHALSDFFADLAAHRLPDHGVFYARGGFGNNDGLAPLDPAAAAKHRFGGSDDHPGYSDAQISEALIADEVNAIAASPYWGQSAIIVTYDESDGLYDHAPFAITSTDAFGQPLTGGPRIPTILISPYGIAHGVSHVHSEHSSVIKLIDALFRLTPLETLPDEQRGITQGLAVLHRPNLGPKDAEPDLGDMTEAFDDARQQGHAPLLPPGYATIARAAVLSLPHYGGHGCRVLNITPTDYRNGAPIDPPPADFNPRPGSSPGLPASGHWVP